MKHGPSPFCGGLCQVKCASQEGTAPVVVVVGQLVPG